MQALICRSLHAANGPSAQQPAQQPAQQQQQQQEQQQQGQDGKRKRGAYTDWFKGGGAVQTGCRSCPTLQRCPHLRLPHCVAIAANP